MLTHARNWFWPAHMTNHSGIDILPANRNLIPIAIGIKSILWIYNPPIKLPVVYVQNWDIHIFRKILSHLPAPLGKMIVDY
jgi:hypothetical protein